MADLGPPDPEFPTVSYLVHFDRGPEGTQNFGHNFGSTGTPFATGLRPSTCTYFGPANEPYLTSAQAKWGITSVVDGDIWSSGTGTMTIGTGEFALEVWWYYTGSAATFGVLDMRTVITQGARPCIYMTGGNMYYYVNTANRIGPVSISTGWNHTIVARDASGDTRLGNNGSQGGSTWADATDYTGAGRMFIGALSFGGTSAASQYFDSVRLSIGTDRGFSGSTYTVPTARFPDY